MPLSPSPVPTPIGGAGREEPQGAMALLGGRPVYKAFLLSCRGLLCWRVGAIYSESVYTPLTHPRA